MFADFVCLFWKVWDFIEFVQCWVLFVSGCFYVFLQFNFPLASDLTIGFASWWCFFWFFSLLRHRKIPLEGFQLSHLNFLMDCKGYIMWHTTWDAHPMVQEENPGRMYLSWRISWRLKWFVTMLWQCLESQRRRGYIQQLGDSHNDGTWRLRHELVVKRIDDSSSCLVSPLLADTVSPVQCPSFLLAIFRGRKQDISIAICISLLYFAWCIPHTIPVFVGWYLRAYQLLPPKTHIVAPKRDLCLPFNISGFVGWCISCLTIWHLQKQSIYCCFFAFAELRFTCWDIRRYEDIPKDWMTISHLASTDGFASTEGSTGLGSQDVGQPWRAKWEGLLNLKWLHVCRFCLLVLEGLRFYRVCSVLGFVCVWLLLRFCN